MDHYTAAVQHVMCQGDSDLKKQSWLRKVNETSVLHLCISGLKEPPAPPRPTYQWQAVKLCDPELILLVPDTVLYRGVGVFWRLLYIQY